MSKFKFLVLITLVSNSLLGQTNDNYSDELLSSSFNAYMQVDYELAYNMFPFIKKRFLEHLKDTSSFANPYDSLSKHIDIRKTSNNLLKTYSWPVRDTGCCHRSVIYAQFKTASGDINFIDLNETDGGYIFITDLKMIEIDNKPYYLILGWGSCCQGTHYATAKIYEIKNGSLYKSEAMFNDKAYLSIGANRGAKIDLKYSPEQKILSYNSYGEGNDSGFYRHEKNVVKWKLKNEVFKRIN